MANYAFYITLLRLHYKVLAVAFFVSLLYGAHHVLMPRFMPEGLVYKPVTYESDPDAALYGIRANAFFARSEFTPPSLLPLLNPLIMGGFGKALGSIEWAFIISDFLFPPLIFLAVYAVFYEMVRRRTAALLFASVFIISPLAALLSPSASFLPRAELLYFSSFEYPKVTFIFYALALLFIFRTLRCGGKKNIIAGGIFFGILFYTYLYDWAYIVVALTLSLVWFALRREWSATKFLAGIIGIGGALSIPYWLNFLSLRRLPHYEDLVFRIGGVEIGRQFRFSSVWKTYARHLAWVGALLVLYRPHVSRQVTFLISLLFTYFVVVNVQVILGFSPQPDHWYRETFLPVALAVSVCAVWMWRRWGERHTPKRVARVAASLFLLLFFSWVCVGQYRLSRSAAPNWGIPRAQVDAYAWLNKHTPVGSYVASISPENNHQLLLFTTNNSFSPDGFVVQVPQEELWERVQILGALWNLSPSTWRNFVLDHTRYFFGVYYYPRRFDASFKRTISYLSIITERELSVRTEAYSRVRQITHQPPFVIDYLLVGPREETRAPTPASFANLPRVYDSDGIRIYQLSHAPTR